MVRFSVWEIINFVLILIALNSLKVQSRDGVFFFFWLIVSMRLRVMLRVSTINSHWEFLEQKNENFRDMSGRRSSFLPRYDARARTPHNTTQNRSRKISCTYFTVIVFWQWSNGGSVSFFRFSLFNLFSRRVFLLHILSVVTLLLLVYEFWLSVRCVLRAIHTFYLCER